MTLHLDVLPVHPQPRELESYTGYLTRLAESNSIQRLNSLRVVTGLHLSEARSPSDFPNLVAYAQLPAIAACSIEQLQATTFYHLLRKFRRTTKAPHSSKRFLKDNVCFHLRYCPQCLEEQGYISLLWRFLPIVACPQHGTALLDCCGHCGSVIPLLANGLRIAYCSVCQQELYTCLATQMSEEVVCDSRIWAKAFAFLLKSHEWEELNILQHVGPQLSRCRQQKQYTLEQVTEWLGIPLRILHSMEGQTYAPNGETLACYLNYCQLLELSVVDIFEQAVETYHSDLNERWIVLDIREETLLQRLNETVVNLNGRFPAFTWFGKQLNISDLRLKQYPSIDARVKQLQAEYKCTQARIYEQLLDKTRQIAEQLAAEGQPVTRKALCEQAGIKYGWFATHPKFVILLQSYASQREACRLVRQQDLFNRVEAAIQTLKDQQQSVTIRAIADLVGMHEASLRIRHYLDPLFTAHNLRRGFDPIVKEQEENELLKQLSKITAQLLTDGQTITQQKVVEILGISMSKLCSYPRIDEWLHQIPIRRRQQKQMQDEQFYERLPAILDHLQQSGTKVTLARISEHLECSPASLRCYPLTWQVISETLRQHETTRRIYRRQLETDYLDRIEYILSDLCQSSQPISVKIVCERLGVKPGEVRHYFRVRARLEQIAEDNRRQYR
jgi:hypothetical protein